MAVIQYLMDGTAEESYKGCVIRTWERNCAYDSDFYADCVNVETGEIDSVEYDTTRFAGGGAAKVDLTEENFRLYQRAAYKKQIDMCLKDNSKSSRKVEVGKVVRVVKGRKVPIGTVGTVFWQKEVNYDRYGRWYKAQMRIGIKDQEGTVYWLNQDNVVVDNPKLYTKSPQQVIKDLKRERSVDYLNSRNTYRWQEAN